LLETGVVGGLEEGLGPGQIVSLRIGEGGLIRHHMRGAGRGWRQQAVHLALETRGRRDAVKTV
jgi:hypothetical protein